MSSGPLFLPATFDDIPHIAVCVGRHPPYTHAGIFFRDGSGDILLLDIDFNGKISAARPDGRKGRKYAWAVPQFPVLQLQQIAAYCERLATREPNVGYSFQFIDTTMLVEAGHDITLDEANGLTCATFVLAVFQSNYMPLVDLGSWSSRPADKQWQNEVLEYMKQNSHRYYGITDERIANAQLVIGCLRYRPEEVLGACRVGSHPTQMAPAVEASVESLEWLDIATSYLA